MTRLLPAALLGLLVLFSGCSADADADEEKSSAEGKESTGQVLTVSGVSFTAPDGWTSMESSKVLDGTIDSGEVDEFAERTRMTLEQLENTMKEGIDLTVISDERTDGFLDNIVVTTSVDGGTATEEDIRGEYDGMGAEVQSFELLDGNPGEGARVVYQLEASDFLVMGESLNMVSGDDLVTITVSSLNGETTSQLIDDLLASMKIA